jgi:hypothetical protein
MKYVWYLKLVESKSINPSWGVKYKMGDIILHEPMKYMLGQWDQFSLAMGFFGHATVVVCLRASVHFNHPEGYINII